MAAFQDDLKLLNVADKVVGMTYSEFGRRIRSNGALGTDHGTAAPLFVFGNCVNNQILGDTPEIDTQVDDQEGVAMQFDFRNVYSTILTDWLGATKAESETVLYQDFDALPLFKNGCNASLSNDDFILEKTSINVFPNPTADLLKISFWGNNEKVTIKLYNTLGAVVKDIANANYNSQQHNITVDLTSLPKGNYFVHFVSRGISKTKKVIKF